MYGIVNEYTAQKLTSSVRVAHASGDTAASDDGVIQPIDGKGSFDLVCDGVLNNPPRGHVPDRTQVKHSFPSLVFRDTNWPNAIGGSCREVSAHKVVTHGRPRRFLSLSTGFSRSRISASTCCISAARSNPASETLPHKLDQLNVDNRTPRRHGGHRGGQRFSDAAASPPDRLVHATTGNVYEPAIVPETTFPPDYRQ
jgi:hypothetical protein